MPFTELLTIKLSLDSMFLFLSRKVTLLLSLLSGLGICCSVESMKDRNPGKYSSTSLGSLQPFCNVVCFLRNWYTLPYQTIYLLNVSANVALIQIK